MDFWSIHLRPLFILELYSVQRLNIQLVCGQRRQILGCDFTTKLSVTHERKQSHANYRSALVLRAATSRFRHVWHACFQGKRRQLFDLGLRYEYSVFVLVMAYILPVFFLLFVNMKVFLIAFAHMTRIYVQEISLAPVSTFTENALSQEGEPKKTIQRARLKREIKIFKTFLIVTCTFLISWTPFVVILLIDSISPVPSLIRHSSIILLYCNSALNPFIYGFFNSEIRKALSETFNCKCTVPFKR